MSIVFVNAETLSILQALFNDDGVVVVGPDAVDELTQEVGVSGEEARQIIKGELETDHSLDNADVHVDFVNGVDFVLLDTLTKTKAVLLAEHAGKPAVEMSGFRFVSDVAPNKCATVYFEIGAYPDGELEAPLEGSEDLYVAPDGTVWAKVAEKVEELPDNEKD